ncbi:hypothetical protein VPNG_05921 [Cytospora leucostoma]|uniref:Dephospho-CoA kinase n=1 Tax=Cytospora leucostoma TaxID=1230097 RepID=A0A423XAX6_9PEZI|nr:hypothetical protein VPNG_05921 [Cytospora leucostoma]
MLIIGLTGGIATGKSTVSTILSSPPHNLPIIDADVLARKVVEPGTPGYRAIVRHFGPTTPDLLLTGDDGEGGGGDRPLNRAALGRRVFGDSPEVRRDRAVLNSIVHPAVRREAYRALLWAYLTGHWAVVWDVPLLFEVGIDRFCGVVVVVAVGDPEVQMGRLRARDPLLSAEEAGARVRSQMDVRVKARRAAARGRGRGVVVLNDGDKEELRRGVERALVEIRGRSPWWWSTALWLLPPLAVAAGAWNLFVNWRAARRWEEQEAIEKAKL